MKLLLDVGNSRVKWGYVSEGVFEAGGGAAHQGNDPQALFSGLWETVQRPSRVVVANVAGEAFAAALRASVHSAWGIDAEFLRPDREACGVRNAYVQPEQLGADRWAALIATHHHFPGAACVIDCGTAITIDALAADGEHLGGLIVPGLHTMRRSLLERTAGISDIEAGGGEVSLLARDTAGGVVGGTLYAAVAFIDRVSADVAAELPAGSTRVITGGDASQVLPLLGARYRHEPDLVLRGLAVVAEGM